MVDLVHYFGESRERFIALIALMVIFFWGVSGVVKSFRGGDE